MPTLLEKKSIIKAPWMPKTLTRQIDSEPSIDVLIDWLDERTWQSPTIPPNIPPKSFGDKVLVLRSGTGSGKSTLLPPYLYNRFFERNRKGIICCQPTKATTTDIPYQILQYNKNLKMGENIGFQTGSLRWKPRRGILFATYGILSQHLKIMTPEQFVKRYSFIIIDEVHSGAKEIDDCLFRLKLVLKKFWQTPDCPFLILTSATFDPNLFLEYFSTPKTNFLDVAGSTFPIADNFARNDVRDPIKYALYMINKIHAENPRDGFFRDILVFLPGSKQIKMLEDEIHKLNSSQVLEIQESELFITGGNEEGTKKFLAPIAVTSENIQRGAKEYQDIFSPIEDVKVPIYAWEGSVRGANPVKFKKAFRRVLLGTNAIETGMTIDTLGYCIDTGYVKESVFNPNLNCLTLVDKAVTQASSRQRRGRVGRKAPGEFYAAYTKETYDALQPLPFADIIKEDIAEFMLGILIEGTHTDLKELDAKEKNAFQMNQFDQKWYKLVGQQFNFAKLDFIRTPSADSIQGSFERLHVLGFIDHEYNPTLFGYFAYKFRKISLENIRMLLAAYHHGASVLDLITIACFTELGRGLGINKRKYKPRNPLKLTEEKLDLYYRTVFADEFVENLFIWYEFMEELDKIGEKLEKNASFAKKSQEYLEKWSRDKFRLHGMYAIIERRDEVIEDMLSLGLDPYYNSYEIGGGGFDLVKLLRRNFAEGMNEILKIKKCLYEGYRLNLCTWNDKVNGYVNSKNLVIGLQTPLLKPLKVGEDKAKKIQIRPKNILVSGLMLMPMFDTYSFVGGEVSVMDGFVDVDYNFGNR
jgi:HrpA-like RNA helicase